MKQQLEQENKQENTVHDPNREHMTLSALWQLWMDNLKSWRQYLSLIHISEPTRH